MSSSTRFIRRSSEAITRPASELFSRSVELADRHSARLGTRSLDRIRVAAALLLKAEAFLSSDQRQRKAIKAERLKGKPWHLSKLSR